MHQHIDNIERYKQLIGDLSVKGNKKKIDICLLGEVHNIDIVGEDTIIQTCKVKHLNLLDDYSSSSFDILINNNYNTRKRIL